jgi:hypothetical protein
MRTPILLTAALGLALLAGCGDRRDPRVYDIPKETPPAAAPAAPSVANAPMSQQTLPDGALNRTGNPAWQAPAHWTPVAPSAMRRATFAINAPEGAADLAVTSFPGDVGGALANVNRWRQQLGLLPISEAELPAAEQPLPGSHHPARVARMSNGETATLSATIPYEGNSWFFKMTGPAAVVERETEAFLQFVRTVDFHHHH